LSHRTGSQLPACTGGVPREGAHLHVTRPSAIQVVRLGWRESSAGMRPAAIRPTVEVTEPLRHRRQDRCPGLRGPGPREGATPGVAQCRHPPGPRLPLYELPGDKRRLCGHRISRARPPRLPWRVHASLPARARPGNGPTSPLRCGPRSSALRGPSRATLMPWRLHRLDARRPHARPTSR
jgi:hypothetical protein